LESIIFVALIALRLMPSIPFTFNGCEIFRIFLGGKAIKICIVALISPNSNTQFAMKVFYDAFKT